MNTSIEKGNALESAVKAIESAILQSSPSLEKDAFLIVGKKIITVEGVRHELDVWVEIDHGKGYKSIFVFECKNWKGNVGKNDIIIFAEKIDAVKAQKGYFVAKTFTKDAIAQAKKDKRITLLNATEYAVEDVPVPFNFHFVMREKEHGELIVEERALIATRQSKPRKLNADKVECTMNGEPLNLAEYSKDWIKSCIDTRLNTFQSGDQEEGVYDLEYSEEHEFVGDELIVDGKAIEKLRLKVTFTIRVARPGFISIYEVATRGRVFSLAPVKVGDDGHIQASFIGDV